MFSKGNQYLEFIAWANLKYPFSLFSSENGYQSIAIISTSFKKRLAFTYPKPWGTVLIKTFL